MIKGEMLNVTIPEDFNLGSFILDINLEEGRGAKTALYHCDDIYNAVRKIQRNQARMFGNGFETMTDVNRSRVQAARQHAHKIGTVKNILGRAPSQRILSQIIKFY